MRLIFLVLITTTMAACATYQGSEIWRRSTCEQIVDVDERSRCEEEATRSESDYEQDVEEALEN